MLMGIYDTSWGAMRSFLSKREVKDEIINFNVKKITPESRFARFVRRAHNLTCCSERVQKLLEDNAKSFEPANAKRASEAAESLAVWVTANVQYSVVMEKVQPLEDENDRLKSNLDVMQQRLVSLTQELEMVRARAATTSRHHRPQLDHNVQDLRKRFERCTTEGAKLKIEVDQAQAWATALKCGKPDSFGRA